MSEKITIEALAKRLDEVESMVGDAVPKLAEEAGKAQGMAEVGCIVGGLALGLITGSIVKHFKRKKS